MQSIDSRTLDDAFAGESDVPVVLQDCTFCLIIMLSTWDK
jgi:hypothetical protein